jgi:GNAT superfamily N-acetyltransferase
VSHSGVMSLPASLARLDAVAGGKIEAMTSGSSNVVIRVADEADVAALVELRALWSADTEPDGNFSERMAFWMAAEGDRRTTWLAAVVDRPVGMASLFEYRRMPKPGRDDSRWGYVGNMFVREDSRNRGIGSALLAEVIAAAEARSYARLVVSPSAQALSLYRRAGFVAREEGTSADVLLVRPGGARY